ncbi:hypothetical protein F9802_02900 [Bacillus aerolatus]|uniref:Uncharacterized protein n=1 Tax=Bacillus aerolatus TaxID=2653354 RepID=A0A6I1FQS6_9BACI|nr:hypothetical protein [Bacillus aerolatus]KAB7709084.1 hypothetical protein F9802_02900 [Bacillus aerolatus]
MAGFVKEKSFCKFFMSYSNFIFIRGEKVKKSIFAIIMIVSIFMITGCSSQMVSEEKKANREQVSEKVNEQVSEKKAASEPVATQENNEEDRSWDGQWVFLSDDNLGQLQIEQVEGNGINYTLGGTRINPNNNSSYANSFQGTGIIKGDKVEFKNNLLEECGGMMEKKDSVITVTVENEGCHTPQVYLNGDYKKDDSITTPSFFAYENGEFNIYGITLGDTPSTTKGLVGNPDYEGPDEEAFYEWIQDYPSKNLFISYFSNKIESIHAEANASELEAAIAEEFDGDYYISNDGSNYLYNPENKQLLIFNENEKNSQMISFFVTYADGNFYYGVENGSIKQK